jgi:hypothetical protein
MYSFAKFQVDHIFLQNRHRKYIKKFGLQSPFCLIVCLVSAIVSSRSNGHAAEPPASLATRLAAANPSMEDLILFHE